ncbi:hypothetical protein C0Q70_19710 [Pomacea canaliculata]|uniref:C1q domain-containing protein n=1 Tax=Pomacea canaliculata TaxID=400727 RepID=A0A2T7NDK3_POMCA|nr:hypothetical protein C0Q70_19710 [Pomacea canaliculata]
MAACSVTLGRIIGNMMGELSSAVITWSFEFKSIQPSSKPTINHLRRSMAILELSVSPVHGYYSRTQHGERMRAATVYIYIYKAEFIETSTLVPASEPVLLQGTISSHHPERSQHEDAATHGDLDIGGCGSSRRRQTVRRCQPTASCGQQSLAERKASFLGQLPITSDGRTNVPKQAPIHFSEVFDLGDGFNPVTGVYTAKYSGVYVINFQMFPDFTNEGFQVDLKMNGNLLVRSRTTEITTYAASVSSGVSVRVRAADQLWVETSMEGMYWGRSQERRF